MNQLRHVGIIMDGNGRWAQQHGRARIFGHIKGARVAKKIITECAEKKIGYLTLYTFSIENWLRPIEEVSFLMKLLQRYLKKEKQNLIKQNIKFTAVGEISRLPVEVLEIIKSTENDTAHCTGMNLTFALSYGSKTEITNAAKKIAYEVMSGKLNIDDISEKIYNQYLSTYPHPDLDLVIRTSGEKRLSNFMLWQSAYAELFFTNTLWPDFNITEFRQIMNEFQRRQRRYGTVDTLTIATEPTIGPNA